MTARLASVDAENESATRPSENGAPELIPLRERVMTRCSPDLPTVDGIDETGRIPTSNGSNVSPLMPVEIS